MGRRSDSEKVLLNIQKRLNDRSATERLLGGAKITHLFLQQTKTCL
jgi:hypothetical protein